MGKINNRLINADPQLSSTSENPIQNKAVKAAVDAKQDTLVSGTNIKTINSESLLGSGDIEIGGSADLRVVETLPLVGDEDAIYLARFNAATSNGIVELPVPTQADAGKSFVIGSDGSVELNNVSITVDSQMSSTSENPVQNKVITAALGDKVDKVTGKGLSTNDYTTAEQTKLAGIEAGAEVNTVDSVAGKTGAVTLVKGDVGLGNVDNTADLDKPISTATQTALNAKVDAVSGKGLSTNDFTDAYKGDVDANTAARHTHSNKSVLDATTASYTTAEETKLSGIAAGAQVNVLEGVQVNGTDLTPDANKKVNVDLSAFITKNVDDLTYYYTKSLTYSKSEVNDLLNAIKTIQIVVVESLPAVGQGNVIYLMSHSHGTGDIYDEYVWVSSTSSYEKIGNTDIDLSAYSTTAEMNAAIASALAAYYTKTEMDTALAGKVDKVNGKGLSTNDYTDAEKTKLAGIEAGAEVNTVTSVAGQTGAVTLTKSDVGLGNVDNTSDLNKPVSTATQTALDAKQATLVSGTNIKTINSTSLLGSGDIEITGHDIDIVASLPTTLEDDTIYLANTNASSAGGVVEFPVPSASDEGKAFVIGESGSVELVQPNADWEASSGVAQILNKPAYATDADIDALFE